MSTIAGIDIEHMTVWGDPVTRDGAFVRFARPSQLSRILFQAKPAEMRAAGIFLRREGELTYLVQHLTELPAPPTPVPLEIPHVPARVRVNEAGLLSWQTEPLRRLVSFVRAKQTATADFSDTGTGKTFVALALARELKMHAHIVTLKSGIYEWKKAAQMMQVECSVINYESQKTGKHPALEWEDHGDGGEWPKWKLNKRKCLLIFDEAQRCKSPDLTQDSQMLLMAAHQGIQTHLLSATIATSPIFMRAAGYALGLHDNKSFPAWLEERGCFTRGGQWYFNNDPQVMAGLHKTLFSTNAVRVRKSDLGDRFPETVIEPVLVEVDGISKVYAELKAAFTQFQEHAAGYSDSKYGFIMAARQRAEFLKVPVMVEMAREMMDEGKAVALFFNFDAPMRECMRILKAPDLFINGSTPSKERKRLQDLFQSDLIPVLGLNVESGGAAISLHGKREREAIIFPTWRADTLKQVFGRVHRAGGSRSRQRILFAARTLEEDIAVNVRTKLDNLDLLNDGDTQGNLRFEDVIDKQPQGAC